MQRVTIHPSCYYKEAVGSQVRCCCPVLVAKTSVLGTLATGFTSGYTLLVNNARTFFPSK